MYLVYNCNVITIFFLQRSHRNCIYFFQLASVLLRQYVDCHWSHNAGEKFKPPETSEQVWNNFEAQLFLLSIDRTKFLQNAMLDNVIKITLLTLAFCLELAPIIVVYGTTECMSCLEMLIYNQLVTWL